MRQTLTGLGEGAVKNPTMQALAMIAAIYFGGPQIGIAMPGSAPTDPAVLERIARLEVLAEAAEKKMDAQDQDVSSNSATNQALALTIARLDATIQTRWPATMGTQEGKAKQ